MHCQLIREDRQSSADISESFKAVLDSIDDAVVVLDENKNCLFCNLAAENTFGDWLYVSSSENWLNYMASSQIEKKEITSRSPENSQKNERNSSIQLDKFSLTSLIEEEISDIEIFVRHQKKSNGFWLKVTSRSLENKKGSVIVFRDITKNKQVEEQLFNDAFYDDLTSLPNRNLLLKYLKEEIILVKKIENKLFGVLFLDIDRFKTINNSLGRLLGDRLLIEISQRMKNCLRSEDTVARLGGDEFAIILKNIHSLNCATTIAERIYKSLTLPFNLDAHEVFANVSIGIAIGDSEYERPEDLLRDADLAMSNAKRMGRAHYQVFNKSMHAHAVTLLQLENDLRRAIERQEFQLHYQPIVALTTRRIVGFEALVRWRHPVRGFLSPAEFITLAEETGLIVSLGRWVLYEACLQMRTWQLQFGNVSDWKMSVNISAKQIVKTDFVEQVKQILAQTKLSPTNLKLEITETSLMENTESTITNLLELRDMGIEFSLDDFGTGYSSLSYLHQFPIGTLKIDRSFVDSMDKNSEKLGIIRAIITLARNLGMEVVAEGVETANQLAQLKVLKCQYGQGYFFAKALDSRAAEGLIAIESSDLGAIKCQLENPKALLEEQLSKEHLLFDIENLQQELEELKQEKIDLEIMLSTTTEHADLVESQLHQEINDRQQIEAELQSANQELERLTILDSLTQLANRRRFDEYLLQEWQRLRQDNFPISLILCDVDFFKSYNDAYGHLIGDHCLQQVALALESSLDNPAHLVARYGGEEFALILPNTDAQRAMEIAELIRLKVKSLKIAHHKSLIGEHVTMSLGVFSMIPTPEGSPELLIAIADKALYEAKAQGRDRAVLALK
ncbi:MAG: diguanylate cyclase domain-containing protein [Xenococcaceae cyanobacterium]